MDVMDLPALNASLNGLAALCMTAGWVFIRRGRRSAHRAAMLAAFGCSVLFLASYLTYHALRGGMSTPFRGTGWIRPAYYAMLVSHIVLAAAIVPLVLTTLVLALRGRFERHRRWARVTYPLWAYVSVTGVLVYLCLYVWFPAPPA